MLQAASANPFSLEHDAAYRRWRERKLEQAPDRLDDIAVELRDPRRLSSAERDAVLRACGRANMAIYAASPAFAGKAVMQALAWAFGLRTLDGHLCADGDGIAALRVAAEGLKRGFIPYTNQPINWHTDGYYNPPAQRIRAMMLHCVSPAAEGGENAFIDPELVYLRLRDRDPGHIRALMVDDVMTIPANEEEGQFRPAQSGPVFAVEADGGLYMRYTARRRNVIWKDDPAVAAARAALEELLCESNPHLFRHQLGPGEGIICNNVLHKRAGFTNAVDAPERVLYRARFFERVAAGPAAAVRGSERTPEVVRSQ